MGKTYSTEELVSRWEDQRYMKNLMGKYANCMILNKEHLSVSGVRRERISV